MRKIIQFVQNFNHHIPLLHKKLPTLMFSSNCVSSSPILLKKQVMYQPQQRQNRKTCTKYINRILDSKICFNFTSSSNPTQVPLLEQIQAKILQVIKNFKPALFQLKTVAKEGQVNFPHKNTNKLDKSMPFSKMGFDSLDITEMVVTMEESFGVQLTDEEARGIQTIGMAIEIFFRKINAKITNKIVEREQQYGDMLNFQKK